MKLNNASNINLPGAKFKDSIIGRANGRLLGFTCVALLCGSNSLRH